MITLRAIPLDDGSIWLDCSQCGPLGILTPDPHQPQQVHAAAVEHLHHHGIAT